MVPSRTSWLAMSLLVLLGSACTCGRAPVNQQLKAEGEVCEADEECESIFCDKLPGKPKVCFRKCAVGCREGDVCTSLAVNDRYACVPERPGLCDGCESNVDCPYPGDRCVEIGGAKVCTRDCSFDGKCPESYRCADAIDVSGNAVKKQCQPISGTCECTAATPGQVVPCGETNSFGTCMGVRTCVPPNGYDACSAQVPTSELCNGRDDDCNGMTDEALGDSTCGLGECRRSVSNCVNGSPQRCEPGAPVTESCNERDDDCDGVVDNGFNKLTSLTSCGGCGVVCAVARGTPACDGGVCLVQACDLGWGDCNQQATDGCETDTTTALSHCGACNQACPTRANATSSCAGSACSYQCQTGFRDTDLDAGNGCECALGAGVDRPDLTFADVDCDGVDGVADEAIFVDPVTGLDTNPGTRAAPKKTLGTAILAAAAFSPKRAVYASKGTYTEAVTLSPGVSVYGGYDAADGWRRAQTNVTTISSPSAIGVTADNLALATELQLFTIVAADATGTEANGDGRSSVGVRVANSAGGFTLRACDVRAGAGSAGSSGSGGAVGQSGGPGGSAGIGGLTAAGAGGTSACGATGGRGGFGVSDTNPGNPGLAGTQATGGAAGGNPGAGGAPGACDTTSSSNGSDAPAVTAGGLSGGFGFNGVASSALGSASAAGVYLASAGASGGSGAPGGGAGGGGSGGGSASGTNFFCTDCEALASGGGGGGGAGGCGGAPGAGGRGGGGSFAILVVNSALTAEGNVLRTASGGAGGRGGDGGSGGTGGSGGAGASGQLRDNDCNTRRAGAGASGARGGDGGRGGGGSGGAGGPSLCVAWVGTAPTSTSNSCTLGAGGAGGLGGTNGFQPAASGPPGVANQFQALP